MRAVPMVILALVVAALACSINISTANIKSVKLTSDEAGQTETEVYGPNDTFYAVVELANAPDDTQTKAVWTAVSAEGLEPNYNLGEYELERGSGTVTFKISPETAWPVGQYRVEIFLNGEKKETLDFEVRQ